MPTNFEHPFECCKHRQKGFSPWWTSFVVVVVVHLSSSSSTPFFTHTTPNPPVCLAWTIDVGWNTQYKLPLVMWVMTPKRKRGLSASDHLSGGQFSASLLDPYADAKFKVPVSLARFILCAHGRHRFNYRWERERERHMTHRDWFGALDISFLLSLHFTNRICLFAAPSLHPTLTFTSSSSLPWLCCVGVVRAF